MNLAEPLQKLMPQLSDYFLEARLAVEGNPSRGPGGKMMDPTDTPADNDVIAYDLGSDLYQAETGGVAGHDFLSTAHTDTVAASAVRGDVVVANATPNWARVALGMANQVFASDATDAAWTTLTSAHLPTDTLFETSTNIVTNKTMNAASNTFSNFEIGDEVLNAVVSGGISNSVFFGTAATIPASAGAVRLGNAESINARNVGDTADFGITFTASDTIEFSATLDIDGNDIILDAAGNIRFHSSVANVTKLKHSTNFPNFALLRDQIVADGSTAGKVSFRSLDDGSSERVFGEIRVIIEDTTVAGNLVHGSLHIRVRDANVETTYISFNDAKSGQVNVLKKTTFNPNATDPGLNFGSQAGDPSTLVDGDTWYNSTTNKFRAREAGASVDMIDGGGGGGFLGDGSDGDVTISSNTDLGTDNHKQYKNLTIDVGVTLSGDSPFLVRCTGTLTLNGTIEGNELSAAGTGTAQGADGAGGGGDGGDTGGIILIFCNAIAGTGTINCNGLAAVAGTNATAPQTNDDNDGIDGTVLGKNDLPPIITIGNEVDTANDLGGDFGSAGVKTVGVVAVGGDAATGFIRSAGMFSVAERILHSIHILRQQGSGGGAQGASRLSGFQAGGGGGGSASAGGAIPIAGGDGGKPNTNGSGSAGGGGGGGGSGGICILFVQTGTVTAITINANGNDGGNGGDAFGTQAGGGGGGGPGNGGVILLIFLTDETNDSITNVTGGTAGTGGTGVGDDPDGETPANGAAGNTTALELDLLS